MGHLPALIPGSPLPVSESIPANGETRIGKTNVDLKLQLPNIKNHKFLTDTLQIQSAIFMAVIKYEMSQQ